MGPVDEKLLHEACRPTWSGTGAWLVLLGLGLGLNEPYHGVHHRHARLPGACLPAFASEREDETSPFPSYWHALWPMLRGLADPRIGRQWVGPR